MITLEDKEKAESLMRQLMVFMNEFDELQEQLNAAQKTFSRIRNEIKDLFDEFKTINNHPS